MSTYHGTTCRVFTKRLSDEGQIPRQYLGVMSGSGAAQSFYTPMFPITTAGGVTTDDASLVTVEKRVAGTSTWTALTATTHYTITGATGLVSLTAAGNPAGDANNLLSISYYTAREVAFGQSVSIEYEGNLENVYKLGNRNPQEIKEGQIAISGTIGQLYADRALMGSFLGLSDLYQKLASHTLYLYPNGETTGQPMLKVGGVKFSGGSISVEVGNILAADVNYSGLMLAVSTVP